MQPSDSFANLIIGFEAEVLHGYLDSRKLLTVGIGHLVKHGEPYELNKPITKEESRRLFAEDTKDAIATVNRLVKVSLNQNQFDALCSFVFNVGNNGFAASSVLKNVNSGNFQAAASSFALWNKETRNGKKVVSKGLTRRRAEEADLFLK